MQKYHHVRILFDGARLAQVGELRLLVGIGLSVQLGEQEHGQEGETADYRWMAPEPFLRLIREEPVLKIQYPRYKPYLDRMDSGKEDQ